MSPDPIPSIIVIVTAVVAIGVVMVIVLLLGGIVGLIGGPARDGGPPSGRRAPLILGAVALVIGVYLGVTYANARSYGTAFPYAVTALIVPVLVIGGAVAIGLVGATALVSRRGRGSTATRSVFSMSGALLLGGAVGALVAAPLGLTYEVPVTTERAGALTLSLYNDTTFVTSPEAPVVCTSAPGSGDIASVQGRDVGRLGTATVRIGLYLPASARDQPLLDIFLDPETLPLQPYVPLWSGAVPADQLRLDASGGRLTFLDLPLAIKDQAAPPPDWAISISGEIGWECGSS